MIIRYGGVALLFMLAVLAWRDRGTFRPAIYIVLVTVTVACMLLDTVPPELQLPLPLHATARILDTGNIVFVWWMGLSMFQDDFKLRWPHWTVLAINSAVLIPSRISEFTGDPYYPPWVNYGLDILTVGIMAHLIFVLLQGRKDDLIEPRRRLRVFFVLAMVMTTLTSVIAENFLMNTHPEALSTLRCALVLPLVIWGFLWLTKFHSEKLMFEPVTEVLPEKPDVDPRDKMLLDSLIDLMESEHKYTEPGLTIRILADDLKTPEHRLRALINQGLGHRNFSTFLNSYRIKAVKDAFAKPENSRIPVLTIAMDVGFNSLAPFNRAFRQSEGMTPSNYRKTVVFDKTD